MNQCRSCSYYDGDTDGVGAGACLSQPPMMFLVNGLIESHRPEVFSDDKACRSYNSAVSNDRNSVMVG